MLLENKVILITGASRGIGLATTERCLAEGASVIANCRHESANIPSLIEKYGSERMMLAKADVSLDIEVRRMMDNICERFHHLDGIVCNAGIISRTADWKNISSDDWASIINVNLIGTWNIIRHGVELIDVGGSIVNVSSIYGTEPEAKALPYSVSKAAIIALAQAIAKEVAPRIRINTVLPGNTLTSMVPNSYEQAAIEEKTLLKRSATAEEIANVIVFLLSDESAYMTGSVVPVDGGYTIC